MAGLKQENLEKYHSQFTFDDKNILALNTCVKYGPQEILHSRSHQQSISHIFNHKVTEVKPITNQKSSGRCWIFALLNVIRQQCHGAFEMDELEFSQTHLFFYDKIERSHFLLKTFVDIAKAHEEIDGRLFMFLMKNPVDDGGQWSMLVNLVEKYGLMPKSNHSDAFSSTSSRQLGSILNDKLREYGYRLREMVVAGKEDKDIDNEIDGMMSEIYRLVAICLGIPAKTFDWEYYDKNKKYHCIKGITPYDFYHSHIKPIFNLKDKVCLVNDPRPGNSYGKLYTVQYLNNMVNGGVPLYVNQPMNVLRKATMKSLKNNEPVWFGCDVGKYLNNKNGTMHLKTHAYEVVFGFSMLGLTKAERLVSGSSFMTHAMVFTGMNVEEETEEKKNDDGQVKCSRWRVENSWGEESGNKGYYTMTDEWFEDFLFEVVLDKKYLPAEVLDVLNQEAIALPAWDPMGALAN